MPTELRKYFNYSQRLRDIESSTLLPEFGEMIREELNKLLSEAIEAFSKCRSKENQAIFDRIENRIRCALSEVPNPTPTPSANNPDGDHYWYKKPLGIIALTVIAMIVGTAVVWVINHYLNIGL